MNSYIKCRHQMAITESDCLNVDTVFSLNPGCLLSARILSNAFANIQGNSNWPMWKLPVSYKDISKMRVIHGREKNTSPCAPCLLILYNKTWVGTSSTSLMHYFTFIRTPFTERNPAEEMYKKDGGQIGQQEERCRGWHKLRATYFTFPCQRLVRFWNKRKPFKWVVHSRAKQWRPNVPLHWSMVCQKSSHLSVLAQPYSAFVLSDGWCRLRTCTWETL